MNGSLHFDYTTVGHVTIDVLQDGSRRAGGSALYSALQAARLGRRALIVTAGVPRELEELLEPYRPEVELHVTPARETTTLLTAGSGAARSQRMLAWAGPIAAPSVDCSILHLAPVARETPVDWRGSVEFVGLTPQGLLRAWSEPGGQVRLTAPAPAVERVADVCDAIVLSDLEHEHCASLIARARKAGALVAITAAERPSRLLAPDGRDVELAVPALEDPVEDLGAGDVFAAALFVALGEGQTPREAAGFATAAAAVRMRGAGAGAIGDTAAIAARLAATAPAG